MLGNQINITSIQNVGTPVPWHRRNQFDEHADLLSLSRLQEETNPEFRRRIKDAFVNIANSSYRGLINGITRELGLSLYDALVIQPKIDLNGNFLATDPYIKFDGAYLLLYSDFENDLLDWAIDRYQPGGNFEHIGKLVDFINTTSFFQAGLRPNTNFYTRSMCILNQTSREQIRMEFLPQSTKFKLRHTYLVPNMLFFSNRDTFRTEMSTSAEVVSKGQYHVDYTKGIVTVYTVPSLKEYARYMYTKYPLIATSSPIILNNINSDNFRIKMFEQLIQENGAEAFGLPTELGVDILNELLSVTPMYWGV